MKKNSKTKILIGMAVHISKDYAMEKWIRNVSRLRKESPADFLMVDNSPGTGYVSKLENYCKKYGVKNYKVKHLELSESQEKFERLARSREVIRQEILSGDYDFWFSWESDVLIPTDTLKKLVKVAKSGNFAVVAHNNWTRQIPNLPNYDWGVSLISRKALEKYNFILKFGSDPEMPTTYEPSEAWFRKRVLRDGGGYLEIQGLIEPVYHLEK